MKRSPDTTSRLSREAMIAYAAMALGPNIFMVGVTFMLPQLYARDLAINLADLGIALLAIRIFDTFADQAIGYLSDRTRARFGSRKPWPVIGITLTMVACYWLFTPPAGAGLAYLIAWRIVYDIGWSMFLIPFGAWGAELSSDYSDRSRINGYCGISNSLGIIVKNTAPIILFWLGMTSSSAYSLEMFQKLFWVCLPVVVVLTLFSALRAPAGVSVQQQPKLSGVLRSVRLNPPFRRYLAGFFVANLCLGLNGLLFTFYDTYLKLGAWYPYLMLGYAAITTVTVPMWVRIANRVGKHRAYGISMVSSALALQAFWLIDPAQHSTGTIALMTAFVLALHSTATTCFHVAPAAMLADVVDYGTFRTGQALAGSYFALNNIFMKLTIAIGTSLGFILLGWFGFTVAPGAVNSPGAEFGLLATVLLLPGLLAFAACLILWRFPLDQRRHGILSRRLARRRTVDSIVEPLIVARPPTAPAPAA